MDNNTPPDENTNPQDSQESTNTEIQNDLDDVDIYEPEAENLGNGKNKIIAIAVGMVLVASYALYSIFYTPPTPKNLNPAQASGAGKIASTKNAEIPNIDSPDSVNLPSPPQITLQAPPPPIQSPIYSPPPIIAPPPVIGEPAGTSTSPTGFVGEEAPPPPPPPAPSIEAIKSKRSSIGSDEESKKRLKSNMLLMDGGGPESSSKNVTGVDGGNYSSNVNDPNQAFANRRTAEEPTENVIARSLTNLGMTVLQGKIVNAVLETAINTDLPGTLRAIVARDTYAEAGRNILIPKGSRLIGTYNTGVANGQKRVMIVWTRLIRPDGVDIQIGSPAVDNLGRAGVFGVVDNHFAELFTASILTSAITIGTAVAVDEVLPTQEGSTTTTPEGNQTTTLSPAQQAAGQAVRDLGSQGKAAVDKIANVTPTITVDQGTRINVFVNKDLTFPSAIDSGKLFIH